MLPLHDDNPSRTTPIVTILLIVLNVVIFLYQSTSGLQEATFRFGLIPAELTGSDPSMSILRRMELPPEVLDHNFNPAWATILSSMFMHGGWLHIIGNMWILWIYGNNVEDAMGKVKYLLFYLAAGAGAAMAQVMLGPNSPVPMVGASGAIAGVSGAYLVLFPGSRVLCLVLTFVITTIQLPAAVVLGFWFLTELFRTVMGLGMERAGGVAFAAHVGGFLVGLVLGRLLATGHPATQRRDKSSREFTDWR